MDTLGEQVLEVIVTIDSRSALDCSDLLPSECYECVSKILVV